MSEQPIINVIDAATVGAHEHPPVPHDHPELLAEIESIRGEVGAAAMVLAAEQSAAQSAAAAEVATAEAFDAQTAILALGERMEALAEELRGNAGPVIIDAPPMPPAAEQPDIPAPPAADHAPPPSEKKSKGLFAW